MIKNISLSACVLLLMTSCKTLSIQQASHSTTLQQIPLGSVGAGADFMLSTPFSGAAAPAYQEPLKVSASVLPFNKASYKAYVKAKALQTTFDKSQANDSLIGNLKFVQFHIADKVALIKAFNASENKAVKTYLSFNPESNVVTDISMRFQEEDLDAIQQADAIFLVEHGMKTYALQLYENEEKTKLIPFGKGVVFAYRTAGCCWQENRKRQLNIVDFVEGYNNCPKQTYRSASRAKRKINIYKL